MISRGGLRLALAGIGIDHLSVSRVAAGLGVSLHTVNTEIIAEASGVLVDDPARFEVPPTLGSM